MGLLHAEDGLDAEDGIHVGVFATGLLAASPAGVAEDVDVRTPETEFGIAGVIDHAHGHIEDVVVGTVPVGTGLVAHGTEHIIDELLAEGGSHADGLGEDGVATLAHAVAGLAPPVVGGDAEAIDGDALVHHQSYFLFGRQHGDQVLYSFSRGQVGVLPRILLLGRHMGGRDQQHGRDD